MIWIDYVVMASFFALLVTVSVWVSRRQASGGEQFFLAGPAPSVLPAGTVWRALFRRSDGRRASPPPEAPNSTMHGHL